MPERIRDYVTSKLLPVTPEEVVRQQFEHMLIDELGYPKDHIAIEFPIQRGAKRRAEKADIAVFKSSLHDQKNLYMVVECEAPGRPYDDQVFSYVTATTAEFGVWFDGLDRRRSRGVHYLWRNMAKDPTKFVDIPAIPRFGEGLEEIGKYKKSQLQPARSLKGLFQKMHNRLYGEGPFKRDDTIAHEVIKLLFCKLYDELYTPGETCEFRATVTELETAAGRQKVGERVRSLFAKLKGDPRYQEMFTGEELQYDDYWISYVVSELQAFGLTHDETDTDAMGDAYEIFVGPQLKGESGQFFTPRAVVKLAVRMVRPSLVKGESIIDPACGSGGFLIYALRAVRDEAAAHFTGDSSQRLHDRVRDYANHFIAGLDTEPLLHKVAKSYMAIVGNGRSGIFREDSLVPATSWRPATQARIEFGAFDIVITNPPFGTKIKVEVEDTLRQYDLAHVLRNGRKTADLIRGGQDPAILFVERCRQLLRSSADEVNGGRMAIVLPRQILSGHDQAMVEIRKWILHHFRLLAVVDLPPEAFQPYTGTITSVLFAERVERPVEEDYPIFMATAQYVGHDRRGNPLVARNADGSPRYDAANNALIMDDTPSIAEAYERFVRFEDYASADPSIFRVMLSEIRKQPGLRLDAWYHDPSKNSVVKRIWDMDSGGVGEVTVKTLGQLVADPSHVFYPGRHKRNYCKPGADCVPFLSGTNILQIRPFNVKWQPRAYGPVQHHIVQKDWILVTRSGSVGRVLYVGDDIAGFPVDEGLAVSEHVIRVIPDRAEVDPAYLFAFLSSADGQVLLAQGTYASVVQHITPDHIRAIPVPLPSPAVQKAIGDKVRDAERLRSKANAAVRELQDAMEQAVTEGSFSQEQ